MPPTPIIERGQILKIAFYSPLKAPDHPVPSGDRTMARLLMVALGKAGYKVEIVSRLRSFSSKPDPEQLKRLHDAAARETGLILDRWTGDRVEPSTTRPDLWLTYHPYYKAPDLLGVTISDVLKIPYITIEASHAAKRSLDKWAPWQALVERSLLAASLNICMTSRDRQGLQAFLKTGERLADLPPFIDISAATHDLPIRVAAKPAINLITVAMMRSGDKLQSYRFLAQALSGMLDQDWNLTVVGDGPMRADVISAFADIPPHRVAFLGELVPEEVQNQLCKADIYVWPGFGEAYGLAYLEAQLQGLPVVALDQAGVSSVVEHGVTGLLVRPDALVSTLLDGYRRALTDILTKPVLRVSMAAAATKSVREKHDLGSAAKQLQHCFTALDIQAKRKITSYESSHEPSSESSYE